MGHGGNKDENFGDEEDCETLNGVLLNSDERQSGNKKQPSHSIGSKMSRKQLEEMFNNGIYKKLTTKLPRACLRTTQVLNKF